MKTLLITSIYSNLWGTDYGGRPSRNIHYRVSLLNILNLKPTKVVCFTDAAELPSLEKFFYEDNNVDRNLLDLRVFDLKDSNYFDLIRSKKDLDKMKKLDRCFEIQYNKFFWFDLINDRYEYDRVYWIDAGLSHGGLFPSEYRDMTKGHNSHFTITLFKPNFLEKVNDITKESILLLAKNNTHGFFWSQTLPTHYFNEYDRSKHIIGGMFGGTPNKYEEVKIDFDTLLKTLLDNESELYMEEQIMTCMYRNAEEKYSLLEFDDWFKRPKHKEGEHSYFYNMFL